LSDTSPEAAAIQADIIRKMTGVQRLDLAMKMSLFARELALTRLRTEHPDWSEWELKRELLRYAFGSEPWPPPLYDDWPENQTREAVGLDRHRDNEGWARVAAAGEGA
jgi:hypothetical protein